MAFLTLTFESDVDQRVRAFIIENSVQIATGAIVTDTFEVDPSQVFPIWQRIDDELQAARRRKYTPPDDPLRPERPQQ